MTMASSMLFAVILILLGQAVSTYAQGDSAYDYDAQKSLLPPDIGRVYLGMPLRQFASRVDLAKAESDYRYGFLEIEIPFKKGNIANLRVRVHGLDRDQLDAIHSAEKAVKKSADGTEYTEEVKRLKVSAIPPDGVVYSMYIVFRDGFDLKAWAEKTYGKGTTRAKEDEYYFYDQQWTKTSSDGLGWLIRAFYDGGQRQLQLLGIIPGTEWDPEA